MVYLVSIEMQEGRRLPVRIESIDLTVGNRGNEKFRVVRTLVAGADAYDTMFDVVDIEETKNGYKVLETSGESKKRRSHRTSIHETIGITKSYISAARYTLINGKRFDDTEEAIAALEGKITVKDEEFDRAGGADDNIAYCPI